MAAAEKITPSMQQYFDVKEQHPGALLMAHTPDVPSFVAGAALLSGRQEKEQAFIVAKQLTYLRPEHFLRIALPTKAQLQSVLLAAPASDSYRESESRSRPREPSPRASFAVTLSKDAMAPTRRS